MSGSSAMKKRGRKVDPVVVDEEVDEGGEAPQEDESRMVVVIEENDDEEGGEQVQSISLLINDVVNVFIRRFPSQSFYDNF
jgi:hypothetical protein